MRGMKDIGQDARDEVGDIPRQSSVAPGTEISYKSSLIEKYHSEHRKLQSLFNEGLSAMEKGDRETLLEHMHDLQIGLRQHLLDEEVNLYIYLRHCYNGDAVRQELIGKFKRHSKRVGVIALDFIRKLSTIDEQTICSEAMLAEMLEIGNSLNKLVEAEELHLYPIYQRPN